jgi:hypothetical protein
MDLAKGAPFSAAPDIYNVTLDVIFASTFGLEGKDSTTTAALKFLSLEKDLPAPKTVDEAFEFPEAPRPPTFDAILTLTESLEATVKSPLPRFHHWVLRQMPYMRKAKAYKEELIERELEKGVQRCLESHRTQKSALDQILQRETALAEKEDRDPVYISRPIIDEVSLSIETPFQFE